MNQERHEHEGGPPELPSDDKPSIPPPRERGPGLDSFSPTGPQRSYLGDPYNLGQDRTFEWRDALGCLWLPAFVAVLSIAIWLGQAGVPMVPLQVGTVAAIIGLGIAFWLIQKARRGV